MTIEALAMPGKGKVKYTGSLGDVMKESIDAAFSVVRSMSKDYKLEDDFYEKKIYIFMSLKELHQKMVQVLVLR